MPRQKTLNAIRHEAVNRFAAWFTAAGYKVEAAPPGSEAELLIQLNGASQFIKVLAAATPHYRGGRGSLGLHWLLRETEAQLVGLADLSRPRGWLLPAEEFRQRAILLPGGRHHLDWIVVPSGRGHSKVEQEDAFNDYMIDLKEPADSNVGRRRRTTTAEHGQ